MGQLSEKMLRADELGELYLLIAVQLIRCAWKNLLRLAGKTNPLNPFLLTMPWLLPQDPDEHHLQIWHC